MSTIGSLNVNLGLNTAKFSAGAKAARSTLGSILPSFSGVGAAVAGLGAALGAGAIAVGFKSLVSGAMESIDATAKVSDRLGITTESLVGLRHAANLSGVGAEEFDGTLEKMVKNLGNAAAKGGPTAEALADIGLDAKQLASQSPDEAFKAIAEGIKGIENPALRAKAATDIFGKSGQKLLNTLMAGREGLDQAAAETAKYGTAVSRVDAAKVEAANDAMTRAGEVVKGLAAQVAVQLSPFIEAAANKFIDLATNGTNMGQMVSSAFEVVAKSVAFVADMWDVLVIGFKGAQFVINKGIAFLVQGIAKLGDGIVWLANKLGADIDNTFLNTLADELHSTADAIGKDLEDTLVGQSSGEKVTAFFNDVRNGAQQAAEALAKSAQESSKFGDTIEDNTDAVAKLIAKFEEQSQFAGMEGRQLEIAKARNDATDEQLAQLQQLDAELTKIEEKKAAEDKLKQFAEQLKGQLQSPLEKFNEAQKQIDAALSANLINSDQSELAKLQAQKDLIETGQAADTGPQRPAALERGTAAAFSAAFGANPADKTQEQIKKINADMLVVMKRLDEKLGTTQTI